LYFNHPAGQKLLFFKKWQHTLTLGIFTQSGLSPHIQCGSPNAVPLARLPIPRVRVDKRKEKSKKNTGFKVIHGVSQFLG
jgi:hypothetical protein